MRKTHCLGMTMNKIKYADIGKRVLQKRGSMGVRAAAAEMDISPATLSRIERGHVADANTLKKIFDWLGVSSDEFFGGKDTKTNSTYEVQIAFKNKKAVPQATASALTELIQRASEEFSKRIDSIGH